VGEVTEDVEDALYYAGTPYMLGSERGRIRHIQSQKLWRRKRRKKKEEEAGAQSRPRRRNSGNVADMFPTCLLLVGGSTSAGTMCPKSCSA